MRKHKTPQAQATLEIAKGLFAVAEALKSRGATVPPAQQTPPMANGLDGAIVEVAKGVHQVAKGVESLPESNVSSGLTLNEQGQFVYRQEERIQFNLRSQDYFKRMKNFSIYPKLHAQRHGFARRLQVVGENADAVTPQIIELNEQGRITNNVIGPFRLTRYVPEITIVMEIPIDPAPQPLTSRMNIKLYKEYDDFDV